MMFILCFSNFSRVKNEHSGMSCRIVTQGNTLQPGFIFARGIKLVCITKIRFDTSELEWGGGGGL